MAGTRARICAEMGCEIAENVMSDNGEMLSGHFQVVTTYPDGSEFGKFCPPTFSCDQARK
jgi:hypothetical protein